MPALKSNPPAIAATVVSIVSIAPHQVLAQVLAQPRQQLAKIAAPSFAIAVFSLIALLNSILLLLNTMEQKEPPAFLVLMAMLAGIEAG